MPLLKPNILLKHHVLFEFLHLFIILSSRHTSILNVTAQYYGVTIALMSLCTFMTLLVLNLHHKGNQVPRWVRLFILQGLGTLMCMRSTIDLKRSHPRNVNNFKVRIKKFYTVMLSNFFV